MPIDFRMISGSEDSAASNFERLCLLLIRSEFPEAKGVEGKGGDEGLDGFVGKIGGFGSTDVVFQFKFFTDTLSASQQRQITDSLRTAIEKHKPQKWILCVPKLLTPSEHRWWEELAENNADTELNLWDQTILQQLVLKHPEVKEEFFPERFTTHQESQLRDILLEMVMPLPEDMAFLLQLSQIAKRNDLDPNHLQSDILEWCLAAKEPLDVAIRSLAVSDFEEAKKKLESSIRADESLLAQKKLLLGNSHLCLRETDAAIDAYNESLQLDGNSVFALVNLGAAHRFNGEPKKAIQAYSTALEIDSTLPQLHNNLGVAWEAEEEFEKAIQCYTAALELDQMCFPALYNRAMAFGLSGNFEKSVADFEQSFETIQHFSKIEAMGSRNPLFPYKSFGSLLLEGIFPILHERQQEYESRGGVVMMSLGGGPRSGGREPTLTYELPQGLTSGVLSQSVAMFYNYSPRDIKSLQSYIIEYCKNRHSHFRTQNVFGGLGNPKADH